MRRRHPIAPLLLAAALWLASCGSNGTGMDALTTRVVTLPDGFKVRAEVMYHQQDMMRGMMFRDSLEEDRGMLFLHGGPGKYPYWMYQVKIPLDIIWLDGNNLVVEISADTPPCPDSAKDCPNYGGNETAQTVLELQAGACARHNIRVGSRLRM